MNPPYPPDALKRLLTSFRPPEAADPARGSVFVARPALPPLEAFIPLLEEIWSSRALTNAGPFHRRFTDALCAHLGVEHVSLVANATLGLMLSARHLGLSGEVITTPFSFVATAHSLLWAGATPVFVDVDAHTLNIDPAQIERAITPRTTAIMGVHCYGRPCDVDAIEAIAHRHGLKVIYDAAHAFGVKHAGESLLLRGDLSVVSFHATKVFNTFEGGAIVCRDAQSKRQIDHMINCGIADEVTVESMGLNAKMSEFNAALGLLQLQYVDSYIEKRRVVDARYRELLSGVTGIECVHAPGTEPENYYAFPILVGPDYGLGRDALCDKLSAEGIFARRYFFPLLPDLPLYRDLPSSRSHLFPVARDAASRVLCLPMYPDLHAEDQKRIAAVIGDGQR